MASERAATTAPALADVRVLARGDADYPAGLRDLPDPPAHLYVAGGALPPVGRAVAIVGARAATPYGHGIAERLARDLAHAGLTVVSGLARGIDAAAHAGALAEGRTLAVIPSALDRVTPDAHTDLARRIAAAGAVVSEVEKGGPFGRGAFVKRNRLIAALAAATVVVEATPESGALTTAAFATALGRHVLAVPGDIDRPAARGTLELLRRGARVCADASDVLAVLDPEALTDDPDARLRALLGREPRTLEELSRASGAEAGELLAQLLAMQWSGQVTVHPGGRWSARA
jgi:DNA processing protein